MHSHIQVLKNIFLIFMMLIILLQEDALSAQLKLDFSQDNRTYMWNTNIECDRKVDHGLSWGFSSSINSMLIKKSIFSNNQDRWQEDGKISLDLDYAASRRLKLGTLFSQEINSLEKRKVINSVYGITMEYDLSGIKFVQIVGAKDINRRWEGAKRKDAGFSHRLEISHSLQILRESVASVSVSQNSSRLTNIPLLERDFRFAFSKNFSSEDSLKLLFEEGWAKKRFYQGDLTEPEINTQRGIHRVVNLQSSTEVPLQFRLDFNFDFLSRGYKYSGKQSPNSSALTDNSSNAQNFLLKVKRGFFKRLNLESFYRYAQTEEDYSENQKDQEMKSGELGGGLKLKISQADSLYLTTSIGVTSFYASKSSAQSNDRDILTLFTWGEYWHVFNPFFSLRFEGGFRNFHQVYISNRLSANNNHNQTYALSPTLIWRPFQDLVLKQNYNIQANYICYDYEKLKESTKNRLFRRASLSNSLNYSLTSRVNFTLGYSYRYEDYGQLIWKDQWVQKPSWERRTHTISFATRYAPTRSLSFSPEYTYERRKSWDHSADLVTMKKMRILSDKFYRNVISLTWKYFVDDRNYIDISGAHRVQKSSLSSKEESDYATVSVCRVF